MKDPWPILANCQNCRKYHLNFFFYFLSSGPSYFFLSDPSPIIVNLVTDSLPDWLTHWLTPVLVNLIDVTLVCEDGNLRLIEVLLLLELMMRSMPTTVWYKFGRSTLVIKLSYCSVCLRFWSWCSGKILKLYCRSDPGSRWRTMVACRMKARYIYTYVGLTTMIWEIQQMNSKSNVCICICKIWIQIQIQMQMHHRHHQLRQDFVGLNLSFCHHHPFAFVQFVALWWLFDAFDTMNLMFAEQTEVFANQIWIFVQPNWIFAQGPLSFLRWNIEH